MGIHITTVASGSALETAVNRFRYRVYVTEMGRRQAYADHGAGTIAEPLDRCSIVLAALDDDEQVVGTIRYTAADRCPDSEYTSMYRMDEFPDYWPAGCSFTTKLMVDPRYRRSTLAARLAMACWDLGATSGHTLNFIDCNEHLVGFFTGLGYLPFPERSFHPEYGHVQVMVLPVRDLRHFEAVGSPFLRRSRVLAVQDEHVSRMLRDRLSQLRERTLV